MKKLMIMSVILAGVSLDSNPVQANSQKCTPQYVVPLLLKGSLINGDFVVPGGRHYGTYINDKTMITLDAPTTRFLRSAQVSTVTTKWVRASNPAYEACEIYITNPDQTITKLELFPYATQKTPK